MYRVGLTIGKFMPLHKGHVAMLKAGSKLVDKLVVMVSGKPNDPIPLNARYQAVAALNIKNLDVRLHYDQSVEGSKDEYGTELSKDVWDYWIAEFKAQYPHTFSHFISSDMYGKKAAELLRCDWVPFDINRELFPISGTMIRNDYAKYYDYIATTMKPVISKTIAVVGPESTGKTMLSKWLAKELNASYIPEYGRTLSEQKRKLDRKDFFTIAKVTKSMYNSVKFSKYLTVMDTDAITTYLFSKIYLGKYHEKLLAFQVPVDLYILLSPKGIPFVQDGTRVTNELGRLTMLEEYRELLISQNKKFIEYAGSTDTDKVFERRNNLILEEVKKYV